MKATVSYVTVTSFLILTLFHPAVVQAADVAITELMYNLEGTDADREWIEIHNVSGGTLNLDDWHFYENDTDHYLNPAEEDGSLTLPVGEHAVIAQDPDSFQADHPSFSGLLIDSTFTLANGGETIAMTNPDGSVVASVSYDPADGADGDGNSLQRSDGGWSAAAPTPGAANEESDTDSSVDNEESGSDYQDNQLEPRSESEESEDSTDDSDTADNFSVSAGSDINAIAGVQVRLTGTVSGISAEEETSVGWSLGNGDQQRGTDIFYAYPHPGEYVATLSAEYAEQTRTDSITIDVATADISISERQAGEDGYIALENNVGRTVDLSGWHLRAGGDTFTLPENTLHLAGETLTITDAVSGLGGLSAELLFPDGTVATTSRPAVSQAGSASTQTNHYQLTDTSQPSSSASPATTTSESSEEEDELASTTATSSQEGQVSLASSFDAGSQSAAAADAAGQAEVFWRWAGLLVALLIAGIGIVVLLGRVSKPADDSSVSAAEFDINEL